MPARMRVLLAPPRRGRPTGSMIQASVLEAIGKVETALAQRLHDGGTPPLYHTALLPTERGDLCTLHLGLAEEEDFHRLLSAWTRRPPASFRLNGELLPVVGLEADPGACPWSSLASRAPARLRLHFRSPTLFRAPCLGPAGPRPVRIFPSPERVLDSLSRRWAAFAPSPFAEGGLAEWIDETDARGRVVDWGGAHPIRGFLGSISWTLTGRKREIYALLALGECLGVGSRTAQGCGHLELELT
jgi:CRISPR-associated endoribonuclease Cas6